MIPFGCAVSWLLFEVQSKSVRYQQDISSRADNWRQGSLGEDLGKRFYCMVSYKVIALWC